MVVLIASSNLISQEISTVEEVYNFEVGDIFHIRGDYGWVSSPEHITKTIDSVVQKSFSSSNDTIFYTIQRHFAEKSSSNPVWTTYDTTILQSYWNLNASINNGNIDTVFNDPDWYNERTINKVEYSIGDADHTKKIR